MNVKLIVYPVKDLARAKAQFRKLLSVEPYVDGPYYVGFRVGDQEIGLDPNGHKDGMTVFENAGLKLAVADASADRRAEEK